MNFSKFSTLKYIIVQIHGICYIKCHDLLNKGYNSDYDERAFCTLIILIFEISFVQILKFYIYLIFFKCVYNSWKVLGQIGTRMKKCEAIWDEAKVIVTLWLY